MPHTFMGGSMMDLVRSPGIYLGFQSLYGTTQSGGTNNDDTVFALAVPEPSTLALVACGLAITALAALVLRRDDHYSNLP